MSAEKKPTTSSKRSFSKSLTQTKENKMNIYKTNLYEFLFEKKTEIMKICERK
jgi:hypothetical protein